MNELDIATLRRQAETPVEAGLADLNQVGDDLSDAFAEDPVFDWFVRDDARREAVRRQFFRYIVRNMGFGAGSIEMPSGGGAASMWMPFSFVGPAPFLDELRMLPTILATTGFSRLGRLMAMREDLDKHHPTDRSHAYLWFIGVARRAQGHGVGSRLLKVGTDRLDAQAMPAYLETQTERNVSLYRRHGFEVISEHRARPDAPMMWSMWRDPLPPDV